MSDSEKQTVPEPAPGAAGTRRAAALRAAARRFWPLLVAVPAGAVAGGGYALVATPQYQADAYVMAVADPGADNATASGFAQAYGRVVAQPEILARAASETGVAVRDLSSRVQAQTSPDAPMIQITASAPTAAQAAKEANAVARSLVAFGEVGAKQTRVQLLDFARAAAPATPSTPSRSLDVAVGGAAGLLLGSLALLARPAARREEENRTALVAPDTTEPTGAEPAAVPAPKREAAGAGA